MLKTIAVAVLLAAAAIAAQPIPPSNALAIRVRLDGKAEAEIHNQADKTITAYKVTGTATFADGRQQAIGWTEGIITLVALADYDPETTFPSDGGFLNPGQTRTFPMLNLPTGTIRAQVTPTAVIYKDRTAIGDESFIASTFEQRRLRAERMTKTITEMEKILADSEIHRAVVEQTAQAVKTEFPTAQRKYFQALQATLDRLKHGDQTDQRMAEEIYLDFHSGPIFTVQRALDFYKVQEAALAAGSIREVK